MGIDNNDIGFVLMILLGQLMLFFGSTVVSFVQSWIFLHISARVGIGLIADFLQKLMDLPLGFFDTKFTGDLLQRVGDQRRIESFLTQSTFNIILGAISIVVFGAVLAWYSLPIFFLFVVSTVIYFFWILRFLKRRKEIDYQAFQQMSNTQNHLIEIIEGMPDVKLQGSQLKRRWGWAVVQAKLFRVQMKSLALGQWQDGGAQVINQLKDILITFLAAKSVIDGQMTLGMMLAVQYMVGRLNAPLQQMIGFIRSSQDASISLERLGEVYDQPNEEEVNDRKLNSIPNGDLVFQNLSFSYTPISGEVLKDINLIIPRGKLTAIVGTSGSGKTTLIKLLLGFYQPQKGNIKVGANALENISLKRWRDACGVVMQDGYIFSDSIANNIAESDDLPDQIKLHKAAETANILEFINDLPLGFNTMIGARGNGISQGQRQRMLIARAVYKDPEFIFLDEATNSLDAKNERIIIENLDNFFKGRTVIVIAHRLSTVRHADQIVVLA
ncbi:MAG: ATP-binding cassette domain-containing protein [Saprospiraceae bacterium]